MLLVEKHLNFEMKIYIILKYSLDFILQYEEGVTRDDLMGVEDSRANSFFTKSLKSRGTVFTLGTRDSVLSPTGLTQDIIVPHTASKGEAKVRCS